MRDQSKSYCANADTIEPQWLLIDAADQIVGRLATRLATILMGKHKPTYTPHVLTGDFVVVINADKVRFSGTRMSHPTHRNYTAKMHRKEYARYSGYPGGNRVVTAGELLEKNPTKILREAVRRMLPKNRLQTQMLDRLKLFAGEQHNHQAQQPQPVSLS